ncbi:MAG: hypothetical protein JWN08_176 [Frankiales bacterium]|nr:hypothetical protein [Frankiales bacterium]
MTRRLLVLPLLALPLLLPGAAWAVTSGEVVEGLQTAPVYVEPGVGLDVDEAAVREAVADARVPVYVAIVTEQTALRAGGSASLVNRIGTGTRNSASSVLVITDEPELRGASGREALNAGVDGGLAADRVVRGVDGSDGLDEAEVTAAVTQFVGILGEQASGGPGQVLQDGDEGTGSGSGLLLGLLALGGAGAGVAVLSRNKKRRLKVLEEARADVESLYGRLGSDVSLLSPGGDPVAGQALADAAERYNATGALMAQADTPGEFAAARRTAVEGLVAARVARERLGLDPGPEVPLPPASGPQLEAPGRVQVGDQEYDGSPTYAPGRGHYYGGGMLGGRMVPGGWYSVPFWETALMASVLGGALGGGGLFGGGYERGYEESAEDAGDVFRGGGGFDDGGGSGFEWGGGSVGGGDWGGGGGGGGDSGGGGW